MLEALDLKNNAETRYRCQIIGLTASLGVGGKTTITGAVAHMKEVMANLDVTSICTVQVHKDKLEKFQNPPEEEIIAVKGRSSDGFEDHLTSVMVEIEKMMAEGTDGLSDEDKQTLSEMMQAIPALKSEQAYENWVNNLEKSIVRVKNKEIRRDLNTYRKHLMAYHNAVLIHNDLRHEDALDYLKEVIGSAVPKTYTERQLLRRHDDLTRTNFDGCSVSPKLTKLVDILLKEMNNSKKRGIIFVKTRQLSTKMVKYMREIPDLNFLCPTEFLGQHATEGGMTRYQQKNVLSYFKNGKHSVIIATSIAEEGIDVTACNLVIRYDHVTNEIVRAQSRGRARSPGSKYYVITEEGRPTEEKEEKNTISEQLMYQAVDEITNYIASNKEKFEQEIEQIQSVAKTTRGITQLPVTVLYKTNQFKVQCRQCSIFLCFSTDLRKVQNTHHVCIGESIWQNITRESENDTALKYDGKSLKFYGSIYCKNKDEVGHVCEFRGIRYPILLIKNIQFEDASGNADIYNKWSKIPFQVEDISR